MGSKRLLIVLICCLVVALLIGFLILRSEKMSANTPVLAEGSLAPDFTLNSTEGEITLSKLKGKTVVLYFYPKADTPGCTKEACAFRDLKGEMTDLGAVILGVSKDKMPAIEKFLDKYSLNFPLLSDPDLKVHQAYGAWAPKTMFGKTAFGVIRTTYVIDAEGVIRKVWRRVKVNGHDAQVLEVVKKLAK